MFFKGYPTKHLKRLPEHGPGSKKGMRGFQQRCFLFSGTTAAITNTTKSQFRAHVLDMSSAVPSVHKFRVGSVSNYSHEASRAADLVFVASRECRSFMTWCHVRRLLSFVSHFGVVSEKRLLLLFSVCQGPWSCRACFHTCQTDTTDVFCQLTRTTNVLFVCISHTSVLPLRTRHVSGTDFLQRARDAVLNWVKAKPKTSAIDAKAKPKFR